MPLPPRGFFAALRTSDAGQFLDWADRGESWHAPGLSPGRFIFRESAADTSDAACGCAACAGRSPSDPQYFLTPTSGVAANGLPIYNWDQAAAQITRESNGWAGLGNAAVVTYGFRSSAPGTMPTDTSGFARFTAEQIAITAQILSLWSDVANISFVRVNDGDGYTNSATMLFGNYTAGAEGASAFAYFPGSTAASSVAGDVWVNFSLASNNSNLVIGAFGPHTLSHEVGHAIGLSHPADYDALGGTDPTYPGSSVYWQDGRMFTVMSYFGSTALGGSLNAFAAGPQLHDIAAAQRLYGANTTTRTGDTTYGFNSNTGQASLTITADGQSPVFAIWDAGGNDTIDFSGYSTSVEIDLREEAFSSAGPGNGGTGVAIGNIAIARGAVIENGIGGSGNDTLIGNAVANVLTGNAGADALDGQGGADTASYAASNAGVSVNLAAGTGSGGHAQGDTLANIENLSGSPFADTLTGDANANVLSGLGGADTLNGGDGDDILYGHSAGASGEITAVAVATGFSNNPVAGAATPADPGFLYIVSKDSGVIWRVDPSTGAKTTFLDIPNSEFLGGGERGVLGLAFHPDYANNGRFFVYLTDPEGDLQVREYHRSANPAVAETAFSIVIEIPKQTGFSNHNGGWLGFSPTDGYLYIATGDGGGGGDPNNNAQNLDVLLGKIIRIDVNSDAFPADVNRNYAIPANNPFVSVAGADEIWAYGVRNPWRLAFDPRNGDLYIADVGQGAREEVDYQPGSSAGGLNYGWRIMEGLLPYNPGPPGTPQPGDPSLILPIYDYDRTLGASITGGEIYLGPYAGMTGHFVFADFITSRLFSLFVQDGVAVNVAERTPQLAGAALTNVVDFVTGTDGQLYAISINGAVYRLDMSAGAEDLGDALNGGAGADQLFGGAGGDVLTGGAGIDSISAGSGDDIINYNFGDGVDASIDGGTGTDRIVTFGNAGGETLDVRWEVTEFTFWKGSTVINVEQGVADMGGGVDWLRNHNSSVGVSVNLALGTATGFISIANIENAWGSAFADTLTGSAVANIIRGGAGDDAIDGGADNDTLVGDDGIDTILGGAGADAIYGLSGADIINAGDDNDTIYYSFGEGVDAIDGGLGTDAIICQGNSGAETLEVVWNGASFTFFKGGAVTSIEQATVDMGLGGDWLRYTGSSASIAINLTSNTASGFTSIANIENAGGGSGSDAITGSNAANNLIGNDGADQIDGAAGNDTLNGGAGADRLTGGADSDTLTGGADSDTFVFATGSGADSINDFDADGAGGQDFIDLTGYGITALDFAARVTITDQGANTLITIDGANTIILHGVTGDGANLVTQTDFILGP